MTIPSPQGRVVYQGAGTTGPFPVPFKFFNASDLKIIKRVGITDTTLVLNSEYTVSGAGSDSGGSVTTTAPVEVGEWLTIILDPPLTQALDYIRNDAFPAESHERGLDRQTQQNIRTRDMVLRAFRVPDGDLTVPALPAAPHRADRWLRFDAAGNPDMAVGIDKSQTLSRAVIGEFLFQHTEAEISSGVTPVDYAYPEGNVRRYGAKGDGVTDDTIAIRSCLAVQQRLPTFPNFSAGPGKVYFPPGEYVVSDTLFFQYCDVEFAEGARIFVNGGDFNVISFGRGVVMYNPCVWVFSPTFASAVYYVSGEHLFQSVDDAPRVLFPTCFGNTSIINNGSKAYHLHSYRPNTQYSGPSSSAISFCRFYGAKANGFNYFALLEADGSHPDAMQSYCNSNLFTDFVFSLCRRGVEVNAHPDSNGCVANKLHGHCNAFTNYGGVGAERAVYVNSDQNDIDIQIWDWALALPSSAVILDTEADRNDIVIRGIGINRVSDSGGGGGANRIRAEGTAGGNASESFRGAMLSRGIDLSGNSVTHETELAGFSGTAPSGIFRLTRSGGFVEIRVPGGGVSGTSNASTMSFATPLPAFFRPVGEKRVAIWVQNNGAFVPGIAVIGTDGSVSFGVGASSGGFATSGTKGLLTTTSIVFAVY